MLIKKIRLDNIEDFQFTEIEDSDENIRPINKKSKHYINNKELYLEFLAHHKRKEECEAEGKPKPPLSNKIGEAILQIAKRRCNYFKYARYTNAWKEELIGNAIEKCVMRVDGFDPINYNNPFSYITSIVDNAIKEQLKREKRQLYIVYKSIDDSEGFIAEDDENGNQAELELYADIASEDRKKFIQDYEEKHVPKKKERRKRKKIKENIVRL